MLKNAFYDPDVKDSLPLTTQLLANGTARMLPVKMCLPLLRQSSKPQTRPRPLALVGKRLNYEIPTLKSKVTVTARKLDKLETGPWKEAVIGIDPVGTIRRPGP